MRAADFTLFTEALVTSAYVRFCLSFLPFKRVAGWLGATSSPVLYQSKPTAHLASNIRQVQAALSRCHKYALWPTECYTLALTGKLLLQRRHIGSTLHIGFRKDDSGKLDGHAWLISHGLCVTGNTDVSRFVVHSSFF